MGGRQVMLAPRLRAIAELVPYGGRICDVGCDHAHIPLYLLQKGQIQSALAMDVIPGPLGKAKDNLQLFASPDERERIELRLSDGLDAYEPGEARTLVIAGMGGWLMRRILMRQPEKTRSFSSLVLQPQSDPDQVRAAVRELGLTIEDERMVIQDGKFYQAFRAVNGESIEHPETGWPEEINPNLALDCEDRFGPVLLRKRDPVLFSYLFYHRKGLKNILEALKDRGRSGDSRDKEKELKAEFERISAAFALFGGRGKEK